MYARKRMQTDRQTQGCMRACRMHDYIHTYRQTGARRTACAHTHVQMHTYVLTYIIHTYPLFVRFDPLRSGQQFFSYVGRTDLTGLNQYKARINGSSSGTQRSDACEARTRVPSVSSQALYNWATALHIHTYIHTNIHTYATPPGRAYAPLLPKNNAFISPNPWNKFLSSLKVFRLCSPNKIPKINSASPKIPPNRELHTRRLGSPVTITFHTRTI